MKNRIKNLVIGLLYLIAFSFTQTPAFAQEDSQEPPVVHAVLFYSPACGHCAVVINDVLPPLKDQYGDQLQIMGVNAGTREGAELFQLFLDDWKIDRSRYGVPALVVGNTHLVGELEIPEQFPGIIENGLKAGGIDWPDIPTLAEIVGQGQSSSSQAGSTQANQNTAVPYGTPLTLWDRFKLDLAGNILAVAVLLGMIITVVLVLVSVLRANPVTGVDWSWVIPILSLLGLFVAGYLSFVEVTDTEAVCGPVGDCNSVQQSPYAILFGLLPVGILGLLGYVGILLAWLLKKYGPESWRDRFTLAMWGMAFFGIIFSIYLTFLEPFVIGATCMWCISSALIITLQFVAATEPVRRIWAESGDDELDEDQ
jgi:uncharacterized membrane protein